ncbi:OYE2-NADPH dehydrogenase (old yellow enzyme) isoform 1 [Apiospora arundinis]|uniref:OYE2-NADPH dehydrogenase (Old yellow enzyme) isoform 1 n=1 Tax=Apiospora arundinis TaxID=335852 RepID=A0ABR2I3W6_9PEZI
MGSLADPRAGSRLFEPIKIANGNITLKHRVILAPLTRNRGTPLNKESTPENPNRLWVPNDVMKEYYSQRATDGGLIVTEGLPPSLEGNGMPGVPGIFLPEQAEGWKSIADAVHAKGGYIYAQLWHSGRANIPQMTGTPIQAPSAVPWDDPEEKFIYPPPHTSSQVKYADHPPMAMTVEKIQQTIQDHVAAAKRAMAAGFDGVELMGGNGYLVEQFLSSNSNRRTDAYGGSPEKRCTFALELMRALADAVGGEGNLALRLTPFGLFNQSRGEQRLETFGHLCRELKRTLPNLSYVSFVEPRFEQIFSPGEKDKFLADWGMPTVDLSMFRTILGETPFFVAGGYNDSNCWGVIEGGQCDGILFGRYFISNPDLPERLRNGYPLTKYDRSRFYGPFEDPEVGYTDYPRYRPAK